MEKAMREIEECLMCLGRKESAEQYTTQSAKAAAVAFALAFLAWSLFSRAILEGVFVSAVFGGAVFIWRIGIPKSQMRLRARKIEKDLPFALMQLSVGLNIGVPFDAALMALADGDYGEFSALLKKSLCASKHSASSVPNALMAMALQAKSRQLMRTVSQLVSLYEQGTKKSPGESVRRMALEQLSRQKAQAKEFSGKLAVMSLAFIVISAIVPALFQAFMVVGGAFTEIPFTALQALGIVALGFPLLDAIMLLYIRSLTPEFLKG